MEKGERVVEAAVRELEEESGLQVPLDYFHDGPSQRASLGAASRFETLWLL